MPKLYNITSLYVAIGISNLRMKLIVILILNCKIMTVINLTPHEVTCVLSKSNTIVFDKAVNVARVSVELKRVENLNDKVSRLFLPMYTEVFGEVIGLPALDTDTFFIVSRMVKDACPHREDLLVPVGIIRDDKGVIIGCMGFK